MKMRRAKLAALFMSAMMAVSVVSPVYAAEETTEAATEAVVAEETAVAEEATEAAAEAVAETEAAVEAASVEDDGVAVVAEHPQTESSKQTEDEAYIYKVTFDTDGSSKVTVYYTDGTTKSDVGTPTTVAPTCTEQGYTRVSYTDETGEKWVSDAFNYTAALGHDYVYDKTYETVAPKCEVDGEKKVKYVCSRCGDEEYDTKSIDALGHSWGANQYEAVYNIKVDSNGKVVLGSDGLPQLEDEYKDGYYNVYQVCSRDSSHVQYVQTNVLILAKQSTSAVVIETSNIVESTDTIYTGQVFNTDKTNGNKKTIYEQLPANDDIEMRNCLKDGYYVLDYRNEDGNSIAQETIVVTAHHMIAGPTVEFTSEDDKKMCTVTYAADGSSYTIKNTSCYLTITYNEVEHCTATNCPLADCDTLEKYVTHNPAEESAKRVTKVSTVQKTVEPSGDHRIASMIRSDINELAAAGLTYDQLKAYVEGCEYADYITLSNNTSDCENAGTIDVTYKCLVCKTDVTTDTVNLKARGHLEMAPVKEETKAATCTEYGTYNAKTYCSRCGDVLREVRNLKEAMKAHTNDISREDNGTSTRDYGDTLNAANVKIVFVGDKVVDNNDGSILKLFESAPATTYANYIGYGLNNAEGGKDEFGVYAIAYSYCDTCGGNEIQISYGKGVTTAAKDNNVNITVVSCTKQSSNGYAGSITLQATYKNSAGKEYTGTYTVPYFTTMSSYEGRVEKEVKSGLTKDSDGVWRYYVDDEVATDYSGLVSYNGTKFYVVNGVLSGESGLTRIAAGEWYDLSEGRVLDYTGVASYGGTWFYITNGKLDTSISGLVLYGGQYFVFSEGRLLNNASGLWKYWTDGKWYYLARGRWVSEYSGVVTYGGANFVVENGVYASDYNGTINYRGTTYNVVNGQLMSKAE